MGKDVRNDGDDSDRWGMNGSGHAPRQWSVDFSWSHDWAPWLAERSKLAFWCLCAKDGRSNKLQDSECPNAPTRTKEREPAREIEKKRATLPRRYCIRFRISSTFFAGCSDWGFSSGGLRPHPASWPLSPHLDRIGAPPMRSPGIKRVYGRAHIPTLPYIKVAESSVDEGRLRTSIIFYVVRGLCVSNYQLEHSMVSYGLHTYVCICTYCMYYTYSVCMYSTS